MRWRLHWGLRQRWGEDCCGRFEDEDELGSDSNFGECSVAEADEADKDQEVPDVAPAPEVVVETAADSEKESALETALLAADAGSVPELAP